MSDNLDDRALTIARLRSRWTTKVTCAIAADQIEADRREIEQLRAERDALRARIEGAPVVKVRGRAGELAAFYVSHSLIGKRVALVPLDD